MSLIRLFFSFFLFSGELNHSSLFYGAAKLDGHRCLRSGLPTRINLYTLFFLCPFSCPTLNSWLIALCETETKHNSFQCNLLKHRKKVHFFPKTQTKPVITNCTLSGEIGKNKKARFPFCSPADTTTTANYSNFTFIPAKLISIQRAPAPAAAGSTSLPASTVQEFPPHLLKLQTKAKMWLWKLIRGCWPGWTYTVIEPDCGSFELRHYEKL